MDEYESLVLYTPGTVIFPEFEDYVGKAKAIAEILDSTELTEDNITQVKKTLANARKVVTALDTRRKEVKSAILEPYSVLEKQVKIITGIINEADDKLRAKVKEMEEVEREEKRLLLKEMWDKREPLYKFPAYFSDPFSLWLTPQHLNKTTPVSKCEESMVAWMEQRERDVATILSMPGAGYIMDAYSNSVDLSSAIMEGNARRKRVEEVREKVPDTVEESVTLFYVTGSKDAQLAELLFRNNNINYRKELV